MTSIARLCWLTKRIDPYEKKVESFHEAILKGYGNYDMRAESYMSLPD